MALEARVSSLETALTGLAESVNKFAEKTGDDVAEIRRVIQNNSRTPWAVVLTALAIGLGIITSLGNSWISPITVKMTEFDKQLNALHERIRTREQVALEETRSATLSDASLESKLELSHAKLAWLADAVNQDRAHRIRIEGLIWNQLFNEPLPLLHVNPIGPTLPAPAP